MRSLLAADVTGHGPRNLPDHIRCTAKTKKSGGKERCPHPATSGARVCRMHGAGAPQVKRAAAANVVRAKAEAAVLAMDPDARSGDWIDALERVLARQESMEEYLRGRVEDIGREDWRQLDAKDAEQLHALVDAYRVALRDLRDTAAKIGALDLDSIRVRIEAGRTEAITDWMVRRIDAYRKAAGVGAESHQAGLAAMAKVEAR